MGWRAPGDEAVGFEHAVIPPARLVSRIPAVGMVLPAVCMALPSGRLVTANDSRTIEQLQAELRELRATTGAEIAALRQREAMLAADIERQAAQQRATAEVLRVIATSPTDLVGVLQQVAEAATR